MREDEVTQPRHEATCDGRVATGMTVDDAALSVFEIDVLDIMRRFFTSYSAPESQSWEKAIQSAEMRFGPEAGPRIAATALGVIREMRCSRRQCFAFNAPDCAHCSRRLTEPELYLISALMAARRGHDAVCRHWTERVTGGGPVARLCAALRSLACLAPDHAVAPGLRLH